MYPISNTTDAYGLTLLEKKVQETDFSYSHIGRSILDLKAETNPRIFRERTIEFLQNESYSINYLSKVSFKNTLKTQAVQEIFSKIEKNSELEDYGVKDFKIEKYDRLIPILWITDELTGRLLFDTSKSIWSKEVESQDEADYLVEELSEMPIPWAYPEGCSARAEIGCQLLKLMGVPAEKIKKIWIKGTLMFQTAFGIEVLWRWHIAPLIIINSGEKFVIDPSVLTSQALSPENYIRRMSIDNSVQYGIIDSTFTYRSNGKIPHISQPVTSARFDHYKKMLYLQHFYVHLGPHSPTIEVLSSIASAFPEEPLEEEPPRNYSYFCIIS